MAAPMSFGLAHLAPAMPDFFRRHPDVAVEVSLSDQQVDLIGEGFDLALRISALEDSSLLARRLCAVRVPLVGAPAYLATRGRPRHPRDLAGHTALLYTNSPSHEVWRFEHDREAPVSIRLASPLRVNNAEFLRPALLAGQGLARQPDFLVWRDLAEGLLEEVLPDWTGPPIGLHLVTPPSPIRPARVTALIDFLVKRLAGAPWTAS
jgi:DNA-binding transcriptional LysR family regulator